MILNGTTSFFELTSGKNFAKLNFADSISAKICLIISAWVGCGSDLGLSRDAIIGELWLVDSKRSRLLDLGFGRIWEFNDSAWDVSGCDNWKCSVFAFGEHVRSFVTCSLTVGLSRSISPLNLSGVFLVLKYSIHSSRVKLSCSRTSNESCFFIALRLWPVIWSIRSGLTLFGRSRWVLLRGAGRGAELKVNQRSKKVISGQTWNQGEVKYDRGEIRVENLNMRWYLGDG